MSRAPLIGRPARTLGLALATVGLPAGLSVTAAPAASAATSATSTTATVNVVHGIPGVAVKLCIDGKSAAGHLRYGNTIVGAKLPATTHRVRLVATGKPCHARAILKAAYTLTAGRDYTIVANLDDRGTPNLKAFINNAHPTPARKARVSIRHTAQAPAVNVWANGTKIIGGSRFTWGKSATLTVPAGTYRVKVTLPGSRKAVIGPASTRLVAGRAYQAYAVGSPGHYRLVTVKTPVGTH